MGKIIGLIIVALLAFYAGWPAYSGYRIKTALDTGNPDLLAAKVDFDGVRQSLAPAVSAEVEKAMTASLQQAGPGNEALIQQLKAQVMPKLVESTLASVVTPETILRIYREGGDFRTTLRTIVGEKTGGGGLGGLTGAGTNSGPTGDIAARVGKALQGAGIDPGTALGGLLGKKADASTPPAPVPAPAGATGGQPQFSLANIKSFALNGPLSYSVGVARDPAASDPDVTATIAFTGGDWKIVGLTPRI